MRALAWNPDQALTEPARLDEANIELTHMNAEERVSWAVQHLPGPQALSSSFGAQAAVSLHMVTRQVPSIPVILIDTGYLFPETYRFVDELAVRLSLNLKVVQPRMSPAWFETTHGRLWEQGVEGIDRYNELRKTEPMRRALEELGTRSWFAGLRRQQSRSRSRIRPSSSSRVGGRCIRSSTGRIATCTSICAGTICPITRCGTTATSRSVTGTRRARSPKPVTTRRRRGSSG